MCESLSPIVGVALSRGFELAQDEPVPDKASKCYRQIAAVPPPALRRIEQAKHSLRHRGDHHQRVSPGNVVQLLGTTQTLAA